MTHHASISNKQAGVDKEGRKEKEEHLTLNKQGKKKEEVSYLTTHALQQ
jgi:hypothetical protein